VVHSRRGRERDARARAEEMLEPSLGPLPSGLLDCTHEGRGSLRVAVQKPLERL